MADTSGMSNEQHKTDEAMSEGENTASTSAGDFGQHLPQQFHHGRFYETTPGCGTPPPTGYADGRTFDRDTAQQGCQPPQGPFCRQDYNEQVNRGQPAQETGRAFPQNVQENLRGNGVQPPPPPQFFTEVGSPGSPSWPEDNHPHEDAEESSREANPRFNSLPVQMAAKVIQYSARYLLAVAGKSEEEVCAMTREEMLRALHLYYSPALDMDPFKLAFGMKTTIIKDPVAPMNGPVSGTGNGRSDGVDGRPASTSRHESPPPLIPLRTDSTEVRERVGSDSLSSNRTCQSVSQVRGKGLGKKENGIVKALKPTLKFDNAGIGHSGISDQFTSRWWEHAFNNIARNIIVEKSQENICVKRESADDTSKCRYVHPPVAKYDSRNYDSFIKKCVLTKEGSMQISEPLSNQDDISKECASATSTITDEELFLACGGRTVHKGARHGLKLNGKLARIQRQEDEYLQKFQATKTSSHNFNSQEAACVSKEQKGNTRNAQDIGRGNNTGSQLQWSSIPDLPVSENITATKKKNKRRKPDVNEKSHVFKKKKGDTNDAK